MNPQARWSRQLLHAFLVVIAIAGCNAQISLWGGDNAGEPGSNPPPPSDNDGNNGGGGGGGNGNITRTLKITPAEIEVRITNRTTPASADFTAKLNGNPVQARWALSTYDVGAISQEGNFTSSGIVSSNTDVIAIFGELVARARIRVVVDLAEDVLQTPNDPGPNAGNKPILDGTTQLEPEANRMSILYPYDGTVIPRGIMAPLMQISAGSSAAEDVKLTLHGDDFNWSGYFHVQNSARPRFTIPQDVWDAALISTRGKSLAMTIVKAAQGQAYGPATVSIKVAPGALRGAVYYQTYESPQLGLWAVQPGRKEPAQQLIAGCGVCHAASANSKFLSVGAEVGTAESPLSGIYKINPDYSVTKTSNPPAGLGGDTRGISFGVFTPDGRYLMRSILNFWGGANQTAWRITDAGTLENATVLGLEQTYALLPSFSPNGQKFLFTGVDYSGATPVHSMNVMDVATDTTTNTLTFSNSQKLLDNAATGAIPKYGTFLPDSQRIVLQEGTADQTIYNAMLPSWTNQGYGTAEGKLFMLDPDNSAHVELANANSGLTPADGLKNYEPFALPVEAAGYSWVVFTSIREYGNTHMGIEARKQLWVAAISNDAEPGIDPSHPPFYLPNQTESKNERGFWSLEACKVAGDTCANQDDCCSGICAPTDPHDADSPKACRADELTCARTDESCNVTADCCNAGNGFVCEDGTCQQHVFEIL